MKEKEDPDAEDTNEKFARQEQDNLDSEGEVIDESNSHGGRKVRRRIKVRKKIRIRKKPSVKKKLRKFAEKAFWVVIVVGFIAALIVMIVELDIRDEKFKQKKKAGTVKIYF